MEYKFAVMIIDGAGEKSYLLSDGGDLIRAEFLGHATIFSTRGDAGDRIQDVIETFKPAAVKILSLGEGYKVYKEEVVFGSGQDIEYEDPLEEVKTLQSLLEDLGIRDRKLDQSLAGMGATGSKQPPASQPAKGDAHPDGIGEAVADIIAEIMEVSEGCLGIHQMLLKRMTLALDTHRNQPQKRQEISKDLKKLAADIHASKREKAAHRLFDIANRLSKL